MVDIAALRRSRDERHFANWDGSVATERIEASEASLRKLIDDMITLGTQPTEDAARQAVDQCVQRFNEMDSGWICTIEREDIFEQIGSVIDSCGFECDEDWLNERDW